MRRKYSSDELSTDVKETRGRRDWVKNAVIIFLAVMLALTFFSNTIMNWSLPEVAAQYPQASTITTKIRGTGTVEAAQTYNVTIQESRTVSKVDVRPGDAVKAGDTLLTLDEKESQELIDARAAVAALQLEYDKMQVDEGDQTHAAEATLQQARDAVDKANDDLYEARQYESDIKWYDDQISAAKSDYDSKQRAADDAQAHADSLKSQYDNVEINNEDYQSSKRDTEAKRERYQIAYPNGDGLDSPEYADYIAAQDEEARVYNDYVVPEKDRLWNEYTSAQASADSAASTAATAESYWQSTQDAKTQYTSQHPAKSVESAEAALTTAENALADLEAKAQDDAAQKQHDDEVAQMDLDAKAQELADAQAKVKDLEDKSAAVKIVSRYNGVVQTVNIAAGDTTTADTPLMVVELTEQGYTLTASVTREQARYLREGMTAEITNLWNSNITMTLGSITADQANLAGNRMLTFMVQGNDVVVGQQLSFSIGDKNQSFDVVVPSSAVHSDADGTFVYTVTVKPSPLGNRYTVAKTKVEVLASDDTHSAIGGEISTADFVITTSAVPLQVGDQVRIAE